MSRGKMEKLILTQGQLHLIIGPMWAGKTTTLQRLFRRYTIIGKKLLLIKPSFDNRYEENAVCSHDYTKITSLNVSSDGLGQVDKSWDVYFIDEGHFFNPQSIRDFCQEGVFTGKHIIIALLNGDYKLDEMKVLSLLLPLATSIEYLNAICMICKKNLASYTIRTSTDEETFVVGNEDKYLVCCSQCHPMRKKYQESEGVIEKQRKEYEERLKEYESIRP